eukprot:PITA_26937
MVEEYNSTMVNDVWEVVPRLQDRSVVGSRWIYKVKYVADDSVEKYKDSAHGVGDPSDGCQGNILERVIEEEVYIEQLEGFETHEKKSHKMVFVKSDANPNPYYLVVENEPLILVLYVNDLLLIGSSRLIKDCKKNLETEFDMKDLGQMHYFLGLEVWQQKGEILLGQGRYATKILKRFKMQDCRPMATPMITNCKKIDALEDKDVDPTLYRQLIGSLMYLINTRLDIYYAVNTLS